MNGFGGGRRTESVVKPTSLGRHVGFMGALLDEDAGDMILGQVTAQDTTDAGYVKIAAVIDSGAETNALPETEATWIHLRPSEASKAGKVFPGCR